MFVVIFYNKVAKEYGKIKNKFKKFPAQDSNPDLQKENIKKY